MRLNECVNELRTVVLIVKIFASPFRSGGCGEGFQRAALNTKVSLTKSVSLFPPLLNFDTRQTRLPLSPCSTYQGMPPTTGTLKTMKSTLTLIGVNTFINNVIQTINLHLKSKTRSYFCNLTENYYNKYCTDLQKPES